MSAPLRDSPPAVADAARRRTAGAPRTEYWDRIATKWQAHWRRALLAHDQRCLQ